MVLLQAQWLTYVPHWLPHLCASELNLARNRHMFSLDVRGLKKQGRSALRVHTRAAIPGMRLGPSCRSPFLDEKKGHRSGR